MVFAAPDFYERAMTLVGLTADALRAECPDPASLLSFADRAEATAAMAAREAGIPTAGLRLDLIACVALAVRSREIAEERIRRARLDRLAQARDEGSAWVLVEEAGDRDQPLGSPYHRIEVHVATSAALVATVEPDETFTCAVYRLQWAWIDPATGRLEAGKDQVAAAEEYSDRDAWQTTLTAARRTLR